MAEPALPIDLERKLCEFEAGDFEEFADHQLLRLPWVVLPGRNGGHHGITCLGG